MAAHSDISVPPGVVSGLRPREFDESIDHTNKEETLWKAFGRAKAVLRQAR